MIGALALEPHQSNEQERSQDPLLYFPEYLPDLAGYPLEL
jgi:hypothetical protein